MGGHIREHENPDPTEGERSAGRRLPLALPLVVTGVILWALAPGLILQQTTPAGADLAGHVYPVWLMRSELLPRFGMSGWSQGWFAGFPVFYFYFPLPALAASLIATVTGIPVAIKLVVAIGPVALPLASCFLARCLGFSRFVAGIAGAAGGAFVFMRSFFVLGGNLGSTLAGEYSYTWSLVIFLLYLGLIVRSSRVPTSSRWLPGTALAASTLSHLIGCIAAVAVSATLLTDRAYRGTVIRSWIVGFGVTGFWSVPFLARWGFSGEMGWTPFFDLSDLMPSELLPWLPAGVLGLFILEKRSPAMGRVMGVLLLLPVVVYLFPQGSMHHGRGLPYLYWSVHFLAGLACGHLGRRSFKERSLVLGLVCLGLVLPVVGLFLHRPLAPIRAQATRVFSGLEAKESWREVRSVMDRLGQEEGSRVFWEDSRTLAERLTSAHAIEQTPYWTEGRSSSLQGLWAESSRNGVFIQRMKERSSPNPVPRPNKKPPAPFEFSTGVSQMRLFGVSHFVTVTGEGATLADGHPDLHFEFEVGQLRVYGVGGSPLVEVATQQPVVYSGETPDSVFLHWFARPDLHPAWLMRTGPPDWRRVESLPGPEPNRANRSSASEVSEVRLSSSEVSFQTTALGIPHLVKVSYFPNWTVEGAAGPFEAGPSLMVVVPTREHVILTFRRGVVEWIGSGLTILTLVLMALLSVSRAGRGAIDRAGART